MIYQKTIIKLMQTQVDQKETNRNRKKCLGQRLQDFKASRFLAIQLSKRDIIGPIPAILFRSAIGFCTAMGNRFCVDVFKF
jgi:hypothetical protein